MIKIDEIDLNNKRVLIRVDLNVPMQNGVIENDARLRAILPTLEFCLKARACILLLSHLGRPEEGLNTEALSLKPIAERLSQLIHRPVRFVKVWLNGVACAPSEIVLCENVRFNLGEKANDEALAKKMAALCDVFVMDAFATAHRAEASTVGIATFAPVAVAGPLLVAELNALQLALQSSKRPLVAIVGGAKVSGKLQILKDLLSKVDALIVGGGIANTFLVALGYAIGSSLYESSLVPVAKELLALAKTRKVKVVVPVDAIVARELSETTQKRITDLSDMTEDEKIGDVGPKTLIAYKEILKTAGTIVWNGPVGIFEIEVFGEGTKQIAKMIADSPAYSLAGGGETLSAIEKYKVSQGISYISTGGGAFLEYLEGKTLPAVAVLEGRRVL